jgi:hypothetical protein
VGVNEISYDLKESFIERPEGVTLHSPMTESIVALDYDTRDDEDYLDDDLSACHLFHGRNRILTILYRRLLFVNFGSSRTTVENEEQTCRLE